MAMVKAFGMVIRSNLVALPPGPRRKRVALLELLALPSIFPLFHHTIFSIDLLLRLRQELCKVMGLSLGKGVKKASCLESLQ